MRSWPSALLGLALAVAAVPALAVAVSRAAPHRDLSVVLAQDPIVSPAGTIELPVLPGTDLRRVRARMDGREVPLTARAGVLRLRPGGLSPGGHLLSLGLRYRGGVTREVTLPVVEGPFAERGAWIESAVRLRVDRELVDGSEPGSLAASLCSLMRRRAADPRLGALVSCSLSVRPSPHDPHTFVLAGRAGFSHGAIGFSVPLVIERPAPDRLSLRRAGGASVSLDDRMRDLARDEGARQGAEVGARYGQVVGPIGRDIGALAGAIAGQIIGAREAPREVARHVGRSVDRLLPLLSEALRLPESMELGRGVSLSLRFRESPAFDDGGGLHLILDARVSYAGSPVASLPGPTRYDDQVDAPSEGSSMQVSGDLVAALLDAYAQSGALSDAIAEQATDRRVGPVVLRGVMLHAPPVLGAVGEGGLWWTLPAVALRTSLPRDIRAVARGTVQARLGDDARDVVISVRLADIGLSCRVRPEEVRPVGWPPPADDPAIRDPVAVPCLSDVVMLVPDLPARINDAVPDLHVLGAPLARLAAIEVGDGSGLRLVIRPRDLSLGADGAPRLTVGFTAAFEAGDPPGPHP